jgi:hypothetical protein
MKPVEKKGQNLIVEQVADQELDATFELTDMELDALSGGGNGGKYAVVYPPGKGGGRY